MQYFLTSYGQLAPSVLAGILSGTPWGLPPHPHEQFPAHVPEIRGPDFTAAGWAQLILMCSREEADVQARREEETAAGHIREATAQSMRMEAASNRREEAVDSYHGVMARSHRHGGAADDMMMGSEMGQSEHDMVMSRRGETVGNTRGTGAMERRENDGDDDLGRREETAERPCLGAAVHVVAIHDAVHGSVLQEATHRRTHDDHDDAQPTSTRNVQGHGMQTQNSTEAIRAYAWPAAATDRHADMHRFLGTNSGGNIQMDAGSSTFAAVVRGNSLQ
jgi:hypothetical protein